MSDVDELRKAFRELDTWMQSESPFMGRMGPLIADHPVVVEAYAPVSTNKWRPVLLIDAVRYLVLRGTPHPLRDMYNHLESLDAAQATDELVRDLAACFVDFCTVHLKALQSVMTNRWVQTNEVNRCIAYVLALQEVIPLVQRPLSVIEIGCSAGLNLLFDEYHYDIDGTSLGPVDSPVRLRCTLRGGARRSSYAMPVIAERMGIDIDPIDVNNDDDALWLRSCIWLGQHEREERLQNAISLARRNPPRIHAGDVLDRLNDVVENSSGDSELCLMNSWTMWWMSPADRDRLVDVVRSIARQRRVWWISFEGVNSLPLLPYSDVPETQLGLVRLEGEFIDARLLATSHHFAHWLDWVSLSQNKNATMPA